MSSRFVSLPVAARCVCVCVYVWVCVGVWSRLLQCHAVWVVCIVSFVVLSYLEMRRNIIYMTIQRMRKYTYTDETRHPHRAGTDDETRRDGEYNIMGGMLSHVMSCTRHTIFGALSSVLCVCCLISSHHRAACVRMVHGA